MDDEMSRANQTMQLLLSQTHVDEAHLANLSEFIEDDAVWLPPVYHHRRYEGLVEIATYISDIAAIFPDIKLEMIKETHNDNESWLLFDVTGTLQGVFLGLTGNGKPIRFEGMVIITWNNDNKVVEFRALNDSLTIFQQLGRAIVEEDNKNKINNYLNQLRELGMLPENM